ncbi:MAG: DUF2905 domain-containing protein [Succiniclasticum sp.]|jgi:hypothetical protein
MGRFLIITGIILVVLGLILELGPSSFPLGHLPGDIHIVGKHGSFYFPIVTCIVLSVVLSLILHFFQ